MYTAVIDYSWRIPSPINLLFLPYRFFSYMCPGKILRFSKHCIFRKYYFLLNKYTHLFLLFYSYFQLVFLLSQDLATKLKTVIRTKKNIRETSKESLQSESKTKFETICSVDRTCLLHLACTMPQNILDNPDKWIL